MTTRLEKPIRRVLALRGFDYIVELAPAGIMFRRAGGRRRMVAPIGAVLELAEDCAARDARREQLRAKALRRIGR